MSPCSKKLSDLKGKKFQKYAVESFLFFQHMDATANKNSTCRIGKHQSLADKLAKKNFEQSSMKVGGGENAA